MQGEPEIERMHMKAAAGFVQMLALVGWCLRAQEVFEKAGAVFSGIAFGGDYQGAVSVSVSSLWNQEGIDADIEISGGVDNEKQTNCRVCINAVATNPNLGSLSFHRWSDKTSWFMLAKHYDSTPSWFVGVVSKLGQRDEMSDDDVLAALTIVADAMKK